MTWVFGTEGGEENKRQIIGLVCRALDALAGICSRTSERHAERGTSPHVRGTTRIFNAFLGSWGEPGRTLDNVSQLTIMHHQARARSVCSVESRCTMSVTKTNRCRPWLTLDDSFNGLPTCVSTGHLHPAPPIHLCSYDRESCHSECPTCA